jgi:tetratricopeptide (TPR) repeat protein
MDWLVKILESREGGKGFSFKYFFVPLTTAKAIILFLFKLNDYNKAVKISHMALNEYSEDYRFWVLLSYAEYNLNNQEEALSAANQMINLKRDDSTIKIYDSIANR